MGDMTNELNSRPLSPGCTPNPSMESPIMHHEWEIYRWTGWKGGAYILDRENFGNGENGIKCPACGIAFNPGDKVNMTQSNHNFFHFECSDDPFKERLIGQWLAVKRGREIVDNKFAYASVPGGNSAYERGAYFDVDVAQGQELLTPGTAQEILEAAREEGLIRLKKYIDDVESGAVPWPDFWGPKPE